MSDGVWQAFLCVPKDGGKWQGEAHSRCHFSGLQAGADSAVPSEKPRWCVGVSLCQEERKRLNSQGYLSPHGRKVFRVWHTHRRLYSGIRVITSFYLGRELYCDRMFFISSWCWTTVLPSPRSRKHTCAHTYACDTFSGNLEQAAKISILSSLVPYFFFFNAFLTSDRWWNVIIVGRRRMGFKNFHVMTECVKRSEGTNSYHHHDHTTKETR